ncbi:MAG: CDP-alcohol phosphatidyltransferase family protein [Pseudomonadota bacterium]|nr:CDP-alcohol phosphatidyltransferase family protein [Pseudomonadota bacterium]
MRNFLVCTTKLFFLYPPQKNTAKPLILGFPVLLLVSIIIVDSWGLPLRATAQATSFYVVAALAIIFVLANRQHPSRFGLANSITLVRLIITALLASTIGSLHLITETGLWALIAFAVSAALLDGLDGMVARSRRETSSFGEKFDMEVDAAFILILAVLVWELSKVGPWVLAAGLLRYMFVAASWPLPALRAALPPSFRRKLACVLQIAASIFALCPLVSSTLQLTLIAAATIFLFLSFISDILQLLLNTAKMPGAQP